MSLRFLDSIPLVIACSLLKYGERGTHLGNIIRQLQGQISKKAVCKYVKVLVKNGILEKTGKAIMTKCGVRWSDVYRVSDTNIDFLTTYDRVIESINQMIAYRKNHNFS